MNHPERIADYVEHILVACNRVAASVANATFETFLQDWSTQDVIIRQVIVVGEAAKRIQREDSNFFKAEPLLSPALVIGMRNKVIHDYDEIDLPTVWHTATADFPRLRASVIQVLLRLRPNANPDSLHF